MAVNTGLKFYINNRILIVKSHYCRNWGEVDFWKCERQDDARISILRESTIEYYLNNSPSNLLEVEQMGISEKPSIV